ncbi:hypothetical protein N9L76_06380 [bacterium]|nr:hypothetical protein [bacterium]|tara:strand:- start:1455 stop:1613 length:159 start_codon:yes stop_codon:yes gene_type:complete
MLSKKQLWKENDEWVVVGSKQNKAMEKGWTVVPDKNPPPVDEPERVDKILAR